MSELNLPYTDEETGPVERIHGLHAPGSWPWRAGLPAEAST